MAKARNEEAQKEEVNVAMLRYAFCAETYSSSGIEMPKHQAMCVMSSADWSELSALRSPLSAIYDGGLK
jgi:hypothetical protein